MQLFATLRGRLIAMVAALVAVTIGSVTLITTSVAHYEIKKLVSADGTLTIERQTSGGRTREVIRGPRMIVRDGDSGPAERALMFPLRSKPELPPLRSLDRSLLWTFLGATLFGVLMAIAIARWISVPVERLTAAARRMEGGEMAVRVEPAGGTEIAALAHGFNAMAAALDGHEEQRRRMVSDVAHELRAPLTNIRCELESMQDGLTAPTPERIASLHDETMHLAHLVDDLQDLALAEAGRLEIDAQPVGVGALARRAAAGMETRARDRGVIIHCDGDDEVVVLADARRAVQILTNLLSNAVAHMEAPGDVRIAWERSGNDAGIHVIDSGGGIPADELPRIFERFYRVDASRSRATGGAGLGLSIVRQLVAAQGGRVWVESEVGRGSTFSFTLPLA